jgi:hypothetical protein
LILYFAVDVKELYRIGNNDIVILGADRIEDVEKVLQQNWVHTLGKEVYTIASIGVARPRHIIK